MRRPLLLLLVPALLGCGTGPELSDDERPAAEQGVVTVAATIGLVVEPDAASCVVDDLDTETARALATAEPEPDPSLAGPLVACLGRVTVAEAALAPLAPDASVESVRCAAERLDTEFVEGIVARGFGADGPAGPAAEVAVASALALCLEPAELLTR